MDNEHVHHIHPIAYIESDFTEKFGIPRQSGLVEGLCAKVVMQPEYSQMDAFRGLEEYSHIWLIWEFSQGIEKTQKEENIWNPTVRPPRLGGNVRVGVFATRSPFRPNQLGLSCVKLDHIVQTKDKRVVLFVRGADLLDGTPIYDIKPYIPYVDSRPQAEGGFTKKTKDYRLQVECEDRWLKMLPEEKRAPLLGVLSQDPRPSYHNDGDRIYGMKFAGFEVKFQVRENVLKVKEIHTDRRMDYLLGEKRQYNE